MAFSLEGIGRGVQDFLQNGLDLYQDYQIGEYTYEQPGLSASQQQWLEAYRPIDGQAPVTQTVANGSIVPGVSNTVLLLGGAVLAAALVLR